MIISIKEARKILGKRARNMSDDEVTKLIQDLDELAKLSLDMYKESKAKGNKM